MTASLRRVVALLVLCAAAAVQAAPAEQPLLRYQVMGLSGEALDNARAFLGEEPESAEERNNFLFFARSRVEQSLMALGHYQALVELQLDQSGTTWQLAILVDPGSQVLIDSVEVRIKGEAESDPAFAELVASNPLRPGQALHHGQYEAFRNRLQALGQRRGFLSGSLSTHRVTVDVDAGTAAIQLHYDSGPRYRFGDIQFDDFPLDHDLLAHTMTFQSGDYFDLDSVQSFQAQLQRTGFFGTARVRPLPVDEQAAVVPVQVDLEPGAKHHYSVGVGYSTDVRHRISLNWRTPLINRYGHRQDTRLEYSPVRPRFRTTYTIPRGHPVNDTLQLRARLENNEFGSVDSLQREMGVRREWQRQQWISSAGLRYLEEDWELGPRALTNAYLLPGVTLSHTTRVGDILNPEAGFRQFYEVEFGSAQAGSEIDLVRAYANWRAVYSFGPRHRLVGRAELGLVNFSDGGRPDLAPSLAFFAGGSNSIRGYAYQSLGPRIEVETTSGETLELVIGGDRLAVASAEYQYLVRPQWRLALFVDGGNAFDGDDFDPEVGAGLGVHYVSPVGAIRLDFGNSVSRDNPGWRMHLTIGAEL